MKKLFQLLGFGILLLTACKSSSLLNKTSAGLKLSREATSAINEVSKVNSTSSLTRQFSDSSGFNYHVTIFPLDTFRFSPNDGFIGLAGSVHISAHSAQLKRLKDSLSGSSESITQVRHETSSASKLGYKEEEKIKQREKPSKGTLSVMLLVMILAVVVVYLTIKNRERGIVDYHK